MITIKDAKKFLRDNFKEGTKCPCCNQNVKQYKRIINSSMAWGLIVFYRKTIHLRGQWVHFDDLIGKLDITPSSVRGDFPKLRHWGLIEKCVKDREDGSNRNGLYRMTRLGEKFVNNKVTVQKYAVTYNQVLRKLDGDEVNITKCLKNKFSYRELMSTY